jgi:CspA family cold shock protein
MQDTHSGIVRTWLDGDGWGVIDSTATPGGCWCHFSSVDVDGYRRLAVGAQVEFTFETVPQDGFEYRATAAWIPGQRALRSPPSQASSAYRSVLTISLNDPRDQEPT